MSDLFDVGRNIVLLRNTLRLTQEEAAFLSLLSGSRLQTLEGGHWNTTVDTLVRISRTLHVDSRVLGIFLMPDEEILSMFRGAPHLPERPGNPLQVCGNILLLRKKMRLSQKQLAAAAHISDSRLREIEHGCANVTTNTLIRISEAFGLSLFQLTFLATPEKEVLRLVYDARRTLAQGRSLEWYPVSDAPFSSDQGPSFPYDSMGCGCAKSEAAGNGPGGRSSNMTAKGKNPAQIDAEAFREPMPVVEIRSFPHCGDFPVCPRCGITLERDYQSFCDRCGQRLDWRQYRHACIPCL